MSLEILIVLILFGVSLVLFVTEWLSFDVVALFLMLGLMTSGILTLEEGLSGFSSPATVAIACMLVLSAGLEETGALNILTDAIERLCERSASLAVVVLLLGIGVISAFINNTAVVALFIPISISLAPKLGMSRQRLLMSLSFVSIFGGMLTLIGTSTNLLISDLAQQQGYAPLSMFELAPVAAILFVVGFVYMRYAGQFFLESEDATQELTERFEMQEQLKDIEIGEAFSRMGDSIEESELIENLDVDVLELRHENEPVPRVEDAHLEAGDILRVRGNTLDLEELLGRDDVILCEDRRWQDIDFTEGGDLLAEVVVVADTEFVGQRIGSLRLDELFGATVLAVRKGSRLEQERPVDIQLRPGDGLLLMLPKGREIELQRHPALVLVSSYTPSPYRWSRIPVAIVTLIGVVLAAAMGWLPVAHAALLGCLVLVVSKCISVTQAYEAINWKIIMLIAGLIPMGLAMQKTGAAQLLAETTLEAVEGLGPQALLGALFLLTATLTNVMSNAASAVVLAPVVLQMGASLGIDPRPLLITVTFGASLSFMTPIGYQTNTLIYSPGNFRFLDFVRVGTPLTLICTVLVAFLVPIFWPLTG